MTLEDIYNSVSNQYSDTYIYDREVIVIIEDKILKITLSDIPGHINISLINKESLGEEYIHMHNIHVSILGRYLSSFYQFYMRFI